MNQNFSPKTRRKKTKRECNIKVNHHEMEHVVVKCILLFKVRN